MPDAVSLLGEEKPITISRAADWDEAHWLVDGSRAFDLTDCVLELWIRPTFDHTTLIRRLSSDVDADDGGGEIIIDDAAKGAFHVMVPRATVEAEIPATSAGATWVHFLKVIKGAGSEIEWWRGTLDVRAGSLAT